MDAPALILTVVLALSLLELLAIAKLLAQTTQEKERLSEDRRTLARELSRYRVQDSDIELEDQVTENILVQLDSGPRPVTSSMREVLAHVFPR